MSLHLRVLECITAAAPALLARTAVAQTLSKQLQTTAGAYASDMSLASAANAMREVSVLLAPHVYMLTAPATVGPVPLANEMVIEQSDGFVLVDAGKTRGAGKRILALIRALGPKPVKAVILTHWHQDHVLGLGPVIEAWPDAQIISSAAARVHLLDDPSYAGMPRTANGTAIRDSTRAIGLAAYAAQLGPSIHDGKLTPEERRGWADVVGALQQRIEDEQGTYLVLPSVTFTQRYEIDDPDAPVEALVLGNGHTNSDIVVWTPKQRSVATGDLVVDPIPYEGSRVLDWPATLRAIVALYPLTVVPGHGRVQSGTKYIEKIIAGFEAERRQATRLLPGLQLTDAQVLAKIDLSSTKDVFAGQDPWLRYWFDQYFAQNAAHIYEQLRPQSIDSILTVRAK